MKSTKADCIRKAINISSQKDFFKFDKSSFNATKIKDNIEITSPKLFELMKTIKELDDNDVMTYGKKFKHIIYSDIRNSLAGIKLVASVFKAYGMSNIYDNKFKINIPKSNDNFALLTSVPIYDKPFPVKLRNSILKIYNERPDNIYGNNIRFLLIDQGFKEGIDVFDVKYIHLVDDLITPSDEKQAIGRGTRFCGQKGLEFHPELGWPLHVFKYKLMVDADKYGDNDAFMLYIKESNIDIKKLYFAAELEGICRFGAVDYEINKAIHEFGNDKDDDLDKKDIYKKYENFQEFKIKDMYESLDKDNNGDFKLVKKAYYNFGGVGKIKKTIFKSTKKFIDISKVKTQGIILDKPLNFIEMRRYIRKYFNHLKWTNLVFKNNCDTPIGTNKNRTLITLNNSQAFVSNFFNSKSCYKGILFWHSVGTGKTCSAVATASNTFEKDGYTILWVTRHTLKPDIWKNVFSQVCSETIKDKLAKGMNIPSNDVKGALKYLNNRWVTPISYKQFTNLINKKNVFYTEMVKRNGKIDPFKKTLIIIDEAHKLYSEDTPANEKPDINALKKALYHSYNKSKEESCKLLLMTATPYTNDPMQLFKLLNLIRENDFFEEDFDKFKDNYLDPNTYKFKKDKNKEFLDRITGYISYLNREKDVRQFAYPVIYKKEVPISTKNLLTSPISFFKLFLNDINDYLEIDYVKTKEIVSNLKELGKKPKLTGENILSQEEALDLCLNKKKKKDEESNEKDNDEYDDIKEFIKTMNINIKAKEAEEKKKAKELEKEEKKKAKELEKEEKKKAKALKK